VVVLVNVQDLLALDTEDTACCEFVSNGFAVGIRRAGTMSAKMSGKLFAYPERMHSVKPATRNKDESATRILGHGNGLGPLHQWI
jgi:hypothetical protein